jgi:uncharacterized membrane protein
MYTADAVSHASDLTFGRDIAQFKELIGLLAVISIVLWIIVLITILIRLYLCHVWYPRRYHPSNPNLPPS